MEKKMKITATFRTSEELWSRFTEKHGKNRARKLREFMRKDLDCPHCKESLEDQVKKATSYRYLKPVSSRCPSCKTDLTFIWDEKEKGIEEIKIRGPEDEPKF